MAKKEKLRIAIVGGGLGGTTAGILLQQRGYDATVYEQAPTLQRIGAGIHLHCNTTRVMRAAGVEKRMFEIGISPVNWYSREWDTGKILFEPSMKEWEERFGIKHLVMHRGDMPVALTDALAPGSMKFDKRLEGLEESSSETTLVFADGTRAKADIVIGADGVNSKIREILLGKEAPTYTGFVAYRAIFPTSLLGNYRVAADTSKWWSDDRHPANEDRHMIIYYLTKSRDEIYFVTGSPDPNWQGGSNPVPCEMDEIKDCYVGFHDEVQRVIDACPKASKWPLLERKPLPLWSRGRIVMLGDACHPMKPHMGQGAGMAIEDAAVLVRCLEATDNDPARAFPLYRDTRIARTSKVQEVSHENTWMHYPHDVGWVFGYDAMTVPLGEAVPEFIDGEHR